jgi:hypothetical protein
MFKGVQTMDNIEASIRAASVKFEEIAAIEESAYMSLKDYGR